jgi:hypothetical protein
LEAKGIQPLFHQAEATPLSGRVDVAGDGAEDGRGVGDSFLA